MNNTFLTLLLPLALMVQSGSPPPSLDWEAIAERIVSQLDPQPNERILVAVKGDQFAPLVPLLRRNLARRGAVDLGVRDAADPELTRQAADELLSQVDAMIILPGPLPPDPLYAAGQARLHQGKGRTVHFHWAGAYPVPGGSLPSSAVIDETYQRALLETDYPAVARAQREFAAAMRGGVVRVTTPLGTDLSFRVGDRPVTLQDGDASARRAAQAKNLIDREVELPCGALRVAPLEVSVEGVIAFPTTEWAGQAVSGLRLHFKRGKVSRYTADSGSEDVLRELESAGEASKSFREFALGFNPLLAVPEKNPWIPYYGYGAGVVRLSLGDNTELGGRVQGPYVRWNFFTDATVSVNGEVWVKDGKLVR